MNEKLSWFNEVALVFLHDNERNDEGDILYALIQTKNLSVIEKYWNIISKIQPYQDEVLFCPGVWFDNDGSVYIWDDLGEIAMWDNSEFVVQDEEGKEARIAAMEAIKTFYKMADNPKNRREYMRRAWPRRWASR